MIDLAAGPPFRAVEATMKTARPGLLACLAALLPTASLGAAEPDRAALAAGARAVLKASCYRCHGQNGACAGGFNYLLDSRRLVERGKLIRGDPRRSVMLKRLGGVEDAAPAADEPHHLGRVDHDLLRDWVAAGAPDFNPPAAERPPLSPDAVLRFIHDDLARANERRRKFLRYFTLAHLHNAGLSGDELETYRHGVSLLLNSLSWGPEVVVPEQIDPAGVVLRINLRDYDWDARSWEALVAASPYAPADDAPAAREIAALAGSSLPHLRGDWFVAAASRPPLYEEMLRLPQTEAELEPRLRVRADVSIRRQRVARAGFSNSGETRHNRLIERHRSAYGAYWKSYDFADDAGRNNLFEHPLGPGGTQGFTHDGEVLFHLPDGLQAYLIVDAKGRRLDRRPTTGAENGISCLECHTRGVIAPGERRQIRDVREHVLKNLDSYGKAESDTILALYPPKDRLAELFREDAEVFHKAVRRALGQTATRAADSLLRTSPVVVLAAGYEQELDLNQAAAEAGVKPDELLRALQTQAGLARTLGALKDGGTVPRQAFAARFQDLAAALARGSGGDSVLRPPAARPGAADVEKLLPDDTQLYATLNARQVLDSELGKKLGLLGRLKELIADQYRVQLAVNALNPDLLRDLETITLAGPGADPDKGLVIIKGRFDRDGFRKFVSNLGNLATTIKPVKVPDGLGGNHELYEITPDWLPEPFFLSVPSNEYVLLSPGKEYLIDAHDKLAGGKQTRLKRKGMTALLGQLDRRQSLSVALLGTALEKGPLADQEKFKELSEKIEDVVLGVAIDKDVDVVLTVTARDGKAAESLDDEARNGLNAALGFVAFAASQKKELTPLVDVLKSIKPKTKDKSITVTVKFEGADVEKAVPK
jgi:hypothetical protein